MSPNLQCLQLTFCLFLTICLPINLLDLLVLEVSHMEEAATTTVTVEAFAMSTKLSSAPAPIIQHGDCHGHCCCFKGVPEPDFASATLCCHQQVANYVVTLVIGIHDPPPHPLLLATAPTPAPRQLTISFSFLKSINEKKLLTFLLASNSSDHPP